MADPNSQRVSCPGCSKGYRWQPNLIGRNVPCKQCGMIFSVPDTPGTGIEQKPAENAPSQEEGYEIDFGEEGNPDEPAHHAQPANNGKCPTCNTPVREGAVICMNCGFNMAEGRKMDAPAVTSLAPEEKKAIAQELKGMKWVRYGLWLNMLSILFMMGMIPLPIAAAFAGFDPILVLSIVSYAALALSTLGSLFCLTAPKDSGGRPILIGSVILSLISTVVAIMVDFGSLSEDYLLAVDLMSAVATVLFLLFFVKLAEFLEFDEIIENARKVLGYYIGIEIGAYLLILPFVGCILSLLIFVAAIYTLILYIGLLIDLNNALAFRINEQSE